MPLFPINPSSGGSGSGISATGQTGPVDLSGTTLTLPSVISGIDKSTVGLGNVDNTSDVNKPISSATQTALNAKIAATGQTGTVDLTGATVTLATTARLADSTDNTKKIGWNLAGITTGTTRTITVPDANLTLVGTSAGQTLSNKGLDSTTVLFQDTTDATKKIQFSASGITTGQTRVLTVPDSSFTLVGTTISQTLTNKNIDTASSNAIKINGMTLDGTGNNTGTWLFPSQSSTHYVVGRDYTQTLTNKTLDTSNNWADASDNTKKLAWALSGITTATTRTWTVPDASSTLVGTDVNQTLSNKTIDTASGNILKANGITISAAGANTGTFQIPSSSTTMTAVTLSLAQSIQNKSLEAGSTNIYDATDSSKKIKFDVSGITTATTRTLTIPDASTTLVGTATTQTLTNKTLDTSNNWADATDTTKKLAWSLSGITTATTRTWTIPNASSTIVGTDVTQTLSNKNFDASTTLFQDSTDTTKKIKFLFNSVATGTTVTFTMPSGSTTLIGYNTTDTLSNKTISGTTNTLSNVAESSFNAAQFRPQDHNMVTWSNDPFTPGTAATMTSGVLYLVKLVVPAAFTATKLWWSVASGGSGAVAGQNFVGLFDTSGNPLCSVGVDGRITAQGTYGETVSVALSAGYVYFGFLFNATSPPQPLRSSLNGAGIYNANLTAANYRCAANGSSRTSWPGSAITMSSNTNGQTLWCGIS